MMNTTLQAASSQQASVKVKFNEHGNRVLFQLEKVEICISSSHKSVAFHQSAAQRSQKPDLFVTLHHTFSLKVAKTAFLV